MPMESLMVKIEGASRIELSVQLALSLEVGLVCVHAMVPALVGLPLGGGEIEQLALVIVSPVAMVETCHWGRRCWRAVRTWWRET